MKSIDAQHFLMRASLDPRQRAQVDMEAYPYHLPVVRHLGTLEFHPKVTLLVGENGSGKSTLLEALAVGMGLNPEGGSKNFHFATEHSHSELYRGLILEKTAHKPWDSFFLRAETFYNVASEINRLDKEPAGAPLNGYHDRAPVALFGQDWNRWLDTDADVDDLLGPESADRFVVTKSRIR